MKKADAINLFGSGAELGRALGLTRGRIAQWKDELTIDQTCRVLGAAVLTGRLKVVSLSTDTKTDFCKEKPHSDVCAGG